MPSIFPFRHETARNATTTGYFLQPGLPPPDHGGKKKEGANPVKTDLHPLAEKKGVDFILSLYLRHTFWNSIAIGLKVSSKMPLPVERVQTQEQPYRSHDTAVRSQSSI